MDKLAIYHAIRKVWLERCRILLMHSSEFRQSALADLSEFSTLLADCLAYERPKLIDGILEKWWQRGVDLQIPGYTHEVISLINALFNELHATLADHVLPEHSLALSSGLFPVQQHALVYSNLRMTERLLEDLQNRAHRAQSELEQINHSKSDFISIAAHELKTPLTIIEGYAAMLQDTRPNDTKAVQTLADGILKGTQRLRQIVDNMIDVSLIDNQLLRLTMQPVWISQLITMVMRNFQQAAAERRIDLTWQPFPGVDQPFLGDAERLYQTYYELTSNAIKFTPDGGKVTISGQLLPGFVEVTFQDTGIGIDLTQQRKIFDKFNRLGDASLHSSSKERFKGGGPGLGLTIARGIVEAHGGALWVESSGHDEVQYPGSTFHVVLPYRQQPTDETFARLFHPEGYEQASGPAENN